MRPHNKCTYYFSGGIICDLPLITFGEKTPDKGFLRQSSDDEKDFLVISSGTPSGSTGPSSDHTTGTGYYAYLEASGVRVGSRVHLFMSVYSKSIINFLYLLV